MSQENEPLRIDVPAILKSKAPNTKVPNFLVRYLMKIVHQDEINAFLAEAGHLRDLDFVAATIRYLNATVSLEGAENLAALSGKVIFAGNHPLGGLDGLIIALLIGQHRGKQIKIFVNDLLMNLVPLRGLFAPVNKTGAQTKAYAQKTDEVYRSDNDILTFPAGMCSRKINGKVQDLVWRKNFIAKAIQHQRDVVPIYFEGKNSRFFYNLALWRKRLGIKVNIEMLFLADEMYKARGKHFVVRIGKPISWQTFDSTRTPAQWATWVREKVYAMA